jgi:hypothetical protein
MAGGLLEEIMIIGMHKRINIFGIKMYYSFNITILTQKSIKRRIFEFFNKGKSYEYYKYKNSLSYKIKHREAAINWQKRNPKKINAHRIVLNALKRGSLIRPKKCSSCNKNNKLYAHHNDYTKPLTVIWLCDKCHKELHKKQRLQFN